MSEYQYYEWQTIDRPLTAREQSAVNELSSHMDTVTSTQAIVTYSWGDFKHDPQKVLLDYFDAFLYDSNFGWRRLIFRLPKSLVELTTFQPYLLEDRIILEDHGKYFTLELQINDDADFFEWVESENILGQLTPLREQLLQGDMRALYLIWLKAIASENNSEGTKFEPPVPAGLKKLNASLQALAEFFEIDPHLISAAADTSGQITSTPQPDLESAIQKLSADERDSHLLQILRGEPGAVLSLKKHLTELAGAKAASRAQPTRTTDELFGQAKRIQQEEERKAREEAKRKKIQRLEKLASNEDTFWAHVENLLTEKRAKTYDEATSLLAELKDMAKYKQREANFAKRFKLIVEKFGKSVALMDRFRRVGLT
ncbi:MAG: hypothetical protein IT315_06745 [Anaerolineales bacterium]|nr:hypothetical protein [Anaerolineales bacterium]